MRLSLVVHVAMLLIAIASANCGCAPKSDTTSIRGAVTYQGKFISNASLAFFPAEGRPVMVATDEEGAFHAALAPGDYQVTITASFKLPSGWKEGDPVPQQQVVIPAEYSNRARTPLKTTVRVDQTQPIDFVLP